jgi:predicted MFS family arabinose efflux permease
MIIAFNSLGIILSFQLPTWYFNEENRATEELFKDAFKSYSVAGAIISTGCSILSILLMKSKPRIPPSISQQTQKSYNFSIKNSIAKIFKNTSFILLLISFICINGFYNFYPVIINDYLNVYFINQKEISYIFIFCLTGGFIGTFVMSFIVDSLRIYKFPCLILNGLMIFSFSIFTALLEMFNDTNENLQAFILIICSIFYGFSLMSLYTLSIDFACELTFPIGESISISLMHVSSQTAGAASTFLINYFLTTFQRYKFLPNVFSIGLFVISMVALFFIKGK